MMTAAMSRTISLWSVATFYYSIGTTGCIDGSYGRKHDLFISRKRIRASVYGKDRGLLPGLESREKQGQIRCEMRQPRHHFPLSRQLTGNSIYTFWPRTDPWLLLVC